jgi:transcriptional regulator with XRE-family HTH domain
MVSLYRRLAVMSTPFGGFIMNFSASLTALRKSRCLSQKQVAEAVGMTLSAYQRYEYGQREPAFGKLIALADFFDVSLDELAGRKDKP